MLRIPGLKADRIRKLHGDLGISSLAELEWAARNGPVLGVFAVMFALWEIAVITLRIPDYILPSPLVIAGTYCGGC